MTPTQMIRKIEWLERVLDDREKLLDVASKMLHQYECTIEALTTDVSQQKTMIEHIRSLVDKINDMKVLREALSDDEKPTYYN